MVTRNFINYLAMCIGINNGSAQSSTRNSNLSVTRMDGITAYLIPYSRNQNVYPYTISTSLSLSPTNSGFLFGTGSSPETVDSYKLDNLITSGITLSVNAASNSLDEKEGVPCPVLTYTLSISNTGSSAITITEIGYSQILYCSYLPNCMTTAGSFGSTLLDRTVLSIPLTLAAGETGIIDYNLTTIPYPSKTVSGIKMVSFEYGTDEEICTIIDAAREGIIDLQQDAGWKIGDTRIIYVEAFSGGTSFSDQDIGITISSFEDYNNCGAIMQFDTFIVPSETVPMNATQTNSGGYKLSRMYTETLPAMVEALPSWLKTRLKTFSVLCGIKINSEDSIESVGNNKLALRSYAEVFGESDLPNWVISGEGSQIDLYKKHKPRTYKFYMNNFGNADVFLRSIFKLNISNFGTIVGSSGAAGNVSANVGKYLSPFGCI